METHTLYIYIYFHGVKNKMKLILRNLSAQGLQHEVECNRTRDLQGLARDVNVSLVLLQKFLVVEVICKEELLDTCKTGDM